MALESFGTSTAKMIDNAVKLCHDLILDEMTTMNSADIDKVNKNFTCGQAGQWKVFASILDGKPAVEIRICVG